MALSTVSMRSLLDSIATRLDESRDITRYLTGLLVFLGLLGTFWGLLSTVASIGDTIRTLDPGSGEARDMLEAIKSGLAAPLDGMGTAFSSSLFGLSGSLVLGFLDLQASRAQNRFYTELENWLSSVTDLGADFGAAPQSGSVDEIRNLADRLRVMQDSGAGGPRVATAMANLAEGISGLVRNMRSEQQILRDWVEAQAEEQKQMRSTLDKLAATLDRAAKES
jgi:biopolymer transport protein ExbB/TolQ